MMHLPAKISFRCATYPLVLALLLLLCGLASNAIASSSKTNPDVSVFQYKKANKHRPVELELYQYDNSPLGRREPLLLVHGLKAEYWRGLRWQMLINHLQNNPEFENKYKIFLVRYDSAAALDKTVTELQAKIDKLYDVCGQKPITIMALSMGGNIVYESLLKGETNKKVKVFLAMATPFHGSPLFSANWLQYGMYKEIICPISRIDRAVAYRLYFGHKANLLDSLSWDNCDQTVPDIGPFASHLPFGPRGNLTVATTISKELVVANQQKFDKGKIIAYAGFLDSSYQWSPKAGMICRKITLPYKMLTVTVPAHLGLEHPVLKMLNDQISLSPVTPKAANQAHSKYVYDLNDGITPITSALFLPQNCCTSQSVAYESDLIEIKPLLDVGKARVFRNIDHLTFIDGYRPIACSPTFVDELNPEVGKRNIFNWILFDLDCEKRIDTKESAALTTYN